MEQETFFTGYCRTIDATRMVCAVRDGSKLLEIDCAYRCCPYTCGCTIARSITDFLTPSPGKDE